LLRLIKVKVMFCEEQQGQRWWFSEISCPTLMLDLRQATEARML